MAASPSARTIDARIRRLKAKHPGSHWRVLRASNGEVAIMRANDVRVYDDGGSVVLLHPISDAGKDWLVSNMPADAPMLGSSYAIERRYVADIVAGIRAEGLLLVL